MCAASLLAFSSFDLAQPLHSTPNLWWRCRMTDQASHGDASPECTRTPYVLWGAGVTTSPDSECSAAKGGTAWQDGHIDQRTADYSSGVWAMESPLRLDVHQAQFAPLMSALLGVPVPTNAMFVLPGDLLAETVPGMEHGAFPAQVRAHSCCDLAHGRLNASRLPLAACVRQIPWVHANLAATSVPGRAPAPRTRAATIARSRPLPSVQALWANVQSLVAAHDKHERRVAASTFLFAPFPTFAQRRHSTAARIKLLLAAGRHAAALPLIRQLGADAEEALLYLNRYHWKALYGVVVATYVAWVLVLLAQLAPQPAERRQGVQQASVALVATVLAAGGIVAAAMLRLSVPVRLSG